MLRLQFKVSSVILSKTFLREYSVMITIQSIKCYYVKTNNSVNYLFFKDGMLTFKI